MESAQHKTVNRAPATRPAPAVQPVVQSTPGPHAHIQLQSALRVSSPKDSAEVEAESTAKKVMRMGTPEATVAASGGGAGVQRKKLPEEKLKEGLPRRKLESPHVARFAEAVGLMQRREAAPVIARKAEGQPNVASNVAADIANSRASGAPLPLSVRRFMEPRFRADFSGVRVHTGDRAAQLSRQLNAQAFTVGNQIFFGKDRFRPDSADGQELIAHELTHTIQQGSVQQQNTVQRSEDVTVTQQSAPQVQRLGISDALDYFADKANIIPGFRMFTIILGVNPINMGRVERSAANILRAIVEFIPGGGLITQALDNHGVFERVGAWVEQQIRSLGMTGSLIRDAINQFLDSLSWTDIFDLGGVWNRAKRIFTEPIDRIISFGKGLITGIIRFIKEAILRPLARLAEGTRGYDLLKAILGEDPVTGDPVPRNADTLIGGFMKLIGQEEIWNNLKRANAVARAWAWFQGAMGTLLGFVRQIPGLFVRAFQSLELADIVLLPRAFSKVTGVFGSFIGRFISWAGEAVWNLLDIIFSVVAPGVMPYLRRAAGAFRTILRNPIGFVGNLVRAGILGFRQFSANFLRHLRTSLIGWITGALSGAGIYIPQALNMQEIIKFVLSVLGLTWQNIRQKLVRAIGEPAVRALETTFDLVVTLVTQGPAAAWEKIQEGISNLRDMVMEQIMSFVRERIVQAAITRLLTSLNPAGAFIQAVIAIYNTVMFFVERLRQIAQVAASFIDSLSAIASGALAPAASRVERTMAGLLTLVISFLARIAGLGRVSDAVTNVINRVRQPIDRALDRVVEWIVAQARRLGRLAVAGARSVAQRISNWWRMRRPFTARNGERHTLYFEGSENSAVLMIATTPIRYTTFINGLTSTNKGPALALATQLDNVKARPEASFTAPNTKDVVVERLFNQLITRTGELLVAAGPGANAYPVSGLDPMARTNVELWQDILPDPIAGFREGGADITRRRTMARAVLLQRYSGGPRNVAMAMIDFNLGRAIRAFDLQANESENAGVAHVVLRHVLNGSGEVGSMRDLALRALLDNPPTGGGFVASAYLSAASAQSAIRGAITAREAAMGGWPAFREHIINSSGSSAMPPTVPAPGARVALLRNPTGAAVPVASLPAYLNGTSYNGITFAGATGASNPLYPGHGVRGAVGPPLTVTAAPSGNIYLAMVANGSKRGGWFVVTSYPVV